MKSLPKSLKFDVHGHLQELAHQRVARACGDETIRIFERAVDDSALVPHVAVVLRGREIAGWVMRQYLEDADYKFARQAEAFDGGGEGSPVKMSIDLLIPATSEWRGHLFVRGLNHEIRYTVREPRDRDSGVGHYDSFAWSGGFIEAVESIAGPFAVCEVRHEFGIRGADKGPQVLERFLAPRMTPADGWCLVDTREHVRRAWEGRKTYLEEVAASARIKSSVASRL